jgi:DNA-binding response OmpR family regulator
LEGAGYTVDLLTDPMTALEVIHDGEYALVITNSVMQGPGGAKLISQMRRAYPALPVLHLDDQSQVRVAEFPDDVPTLTKPFHHGELLDAVRALAGG